MKLVKGIRDKRIKAMQDLYKLALADNDMSKEDIYRLLKEHMEKHREDIKEQIKGQGLWGKLAAKTPISVAQISIKAVNKNKRKVIVGFWNKAMRISTAWIPTAWRLKFIAARWSKISKDAF